MGLTYWRGQDGYEAARASALWNARIPDRYPDAIVQAHDVYDVVSAIKLAKVQNLRVAVRSGGRSWHGNHIRDGGLLLDVSRMKSVSVDKATMRAVAEPGLGGDDLLALLTRDGLFFPVGHCRGVCIGGYLLQGGYGWHSRALGPACMSVEGIDLVTADGDVIFANETENSDYYWAARGAGPGFFGVITRFHLRLYRRPQFVGMALQHYPVEMLDEVFTWADSVSGAVSDSVELMLLVSKHVDRVHGTGIAVVAPVITDTLEEARAATAFMAESPLRKAAALNVPLIPTGFRMLYRGVSRLYPDGYRYAVDNMWTHAPIKDLLPGLRKIANNFPTPSSHMMWMNWDPPADRPDMAYSLEDKTYIAVYTSWKNAEEDDAIASWATERMREMEDLSTGCQLADENLLLRPSPFMSDNHMARLDRIREIRDPNARFYPWLGRPPVTWSSTNTAQEPVP